MIRPRLPMRPRRSPCPRRAALVLVLGLATLVGVTELAHAQADDTEEGAEGEGKDKKKEATNTIKLVLSYGLAIAGAAVVGIGVAETFTRSLSYPSAKLGLINLLRTNPNHAEQVCRSMPGTFYEPIAAAFKTAAMIGAQQPALYPTATKPAYDGGAMMVAVKWKGVFGKAKLGAMAAAGGLALVAVGGELPVPIVLLVILVLLGLGRIFLHKAEVDRTIVLARVEVLPEVDLALAGGRYAFPPRPAA